MLDLYSSHAAALRDALRHAVERGDMSSLGVLHQGVPSAATLTGRMPRPRPRVSVVSSNASRPVPRALLVIACAPRSLKCSSGARCCAGSYPNPEWVEAMRVVLAHVAPLLTKLVANEALHRAIMPTPRRARTKRRYRLRNAAASTAILSPRTSPSSKPTQKPRPPGTYRRVK